MDLKDQKMSQNGLDLWPEKPARVLVWRCDACGTTAWHGVNASRDPFDDPGFPHSRTELAQFAHNHQILDCNSTEVYWLDGFENGD